MSDPITWEQASPAGAVAPPGAARLLDPALVPARTPGRLTFAWDGPGGDLRWDSSGAYAVLTTVAARKGQYRPDRAHGTYLHRVVQDKSTTGSELSAYASDGGKQLAADGLIQDFRAAASRARVGRWDLTISWSTNGAQQPPRTLRY